MNKTIIKDPKYSIPNYHTDYANDLYLELKGTNDDLVNLYKNQYKNNLIEQKNYEKDIKFSSNVLGYINEIQRHDKKPTVHNKYKNRQLEINNYYIMKYNSESYILKLIIFFCGLALVGCLFHLKGYVDDTIYAVYLGIILSIATIIISYNIYLLIFRSNSYFDEDDYGYLYKIGRDMDNLQKPKV
jgi:hypothetical protein